MNTIDPTLGRQSLSLLLLRYIFLVLVYINIIKQGTTAVFLFVCHVILLQGPSKEQNSCKLVRDMLNGRAYHEVLQLDVNFTPLGRPYSDSG